MNLKLKSLNYKYAYQLTKFLERSIDTSLTEALTNEIKNYKGAIRPHIVQYISILDLNDNCQPIFALDTPEFLTEFLYRTYADCHNFMVERPNEIND